MSVCQAPDCTATLGRRNVSGYCKQHQAKFGRKPDHGERVRAGIKRKFATDPVYAAGLRRRARELGERPEIVAKRTAHFGDHIRALGRIASKSPESRQKTGRTISEQRMAWCPPELREHYRHLIRSKRFPAAEAKAMILAQHALHRPAPLTPATPERQDNAALKPLLGYASEAAEYVAVHDRCPVIKLPDGRWRYGTAPKDAEQIVAMAVRKGWQRWDTAALRSAAGGRV